MNGNETPKEMPKETPKETLKEAPKIDPRYAKMRLKLYKKPKPGQEPPQPTGDLNSFLDDLPAPPPEKLKKISWLVQDKRRPIIILGVLALLFLAAVFSFAYHPAPPELTGPRDRTALLSACQQGNSIACSELALLDYLGLNILDGTTGNIPVNKNNAFFLARLGCAKDSAFGCFMMWHLWSEGANGILKPETATETLKKGCLLENKLCCLLAEKFPGRKGITPEEMDITIAAATAGASPSRYAENEREHRLFELFLSKAHNGGRR